MVPSGGATLLLSDCHRTHLQSTKTVKFKFQTKSALKNLTTKQNSGATSTWAEAVQQMGRSTGQVARKADFWLYRPSSPERAVPKFDICQTKLALYDVVPDLPEGHSWVWTGGLLGPSCWCWYRPRGGWGGLCPVWQVPEQGCCSSSESRNLPLFWKSRLWTKITSDPRLSQINVLKAWFCDTKPLTRTVKDQAHTIFLFLISLYTYGIYLTMPIWNCTCKSLRHRNKSYLVIKVILWWKLSCDKS